MLGLKIPFTGLQKQYHNLRQEILDVTDQVLRSGQVMNGNWATEWEHWLAQRNHVQHAVTCHSGTQALEIIASYKRKLIQGRVPRVFLPAVTYPATANAWIRAGWKVHFIDVDRYGIMNRDAVPDLVDYDSVCVVGLYGASLPLWQDNVQSWTNDLVEDAAQHWLAGDCRRQGIAAAISFDPTKNLGNYANGGAIVTEHSELARYAMNWRDNGRTEQWTSRQPVTNSRMSEVDCAQMMVKTRYIDQWQQRRSKIARYWMERLSESSIRCLIDHTNVQTHCFHKFVVELDNRDRVRRQMTIRQIETRVHYERPLHELAAYSHYPAPNMLGSASALCRRVLSLPIYPELTDLEVEYIIDQLLDCVAEERS